MKPTQLPAPCLLAAPFLAAVFFAAVGCRPKPIDWTEPAVRRAYGTLPGLAAAEDPRLRDHHQRLVAARATPELLAARPTAERASAPADRNSTAALLADLHHEAGEAAWHEIETLHAQLAFPVEWLVLQQAPGLRRRHDQRRIAWRAALDAPDSEPWLDPRDGLLADPAALDGFLLGYRLERLRLAELLAERRLEHAPESLERLLRAVEQLSRQPHPLARLEGARRRIELFQAMAYALGLPEFPWESRRRLAALLEEQLRDWPAETAMWLHEQAIGLHTYELVRDGHLLSLLSIEELAELRRREAIEELPAAVLANVDSDQLFYLETMDSLLAAAAKPYHERREWAEQLAARREAAAGTREYPWIAENLLFGHLDTAAELLARERALCEGWRLALVAAENESAHPESLNPLTGEPYRLSREAGRVVVRGAGGPDDGDISLPLPE